MPYKCKKCGRDVIVSYRRFEGDGKFISVSVEMPSGKIRDVEQCPICANPLMVYDDMEFIPPKEYHREKERTAAI